MVAVTIANAWTTLRCFCDDGRIVTEEHFLRYRRTWLDERCYCVLFSVALQLTREHMKSLLKHYLVSGSGVGGVRQLQRERGLLCPKHVPNMSETLLKHNKRRWSWSVYDSGCLRRQRRWATEESFDWASRHNLKRWISDQLTVMASTLCTGDSCWRLCFCHSRPHRDGETCKKPAAARHRGKTSSTTFSFDNSSRRRREDARATVGGLRPLETAENWH